jgi:hypothetical protein
MEELGGSLLEHVLAIKQSALRKMSRSKLLP